jgi:hypothetical protein
VQQLLGHLGGLATPRLTNDHEYLHGDKTAKATDDKMKSMLACVDMSCVIWVILPLPVSPMTSNTCSNRKQVCRIMPAYTERVEVIQVVLPTAVSPMTTSTC